MKQETRREEILKTAAILFKERGYSAVTMRDIAKVMGIKAASLYNHINSKQEILKDIIISLAEEFTERLKVISNSDKTSIEKLKLIIKLHIDIASQNPNKIATLNSDWVHLEERLDYYLELRDNYEDDFRDIIRKGIHDNEIIDIQPDVILFSILSTLRSLYLWIPKKEDLNSEELSSSLSKSLITGINK